MYKEEKFELAPGRNRARYRCDRRIVQRSEDISRRLGEPEAVTHRAAVELIGRYPELNQHHGFAMVYHG